MTKYDHIVIGFGLAGATLAVELARRGLSVAAIDPEHEVTSSRIAAGLITPVTGKRLSVADRWDELWRTAKHFYEGLEADVSSRFFEIAPAVRFFKNEAEVARFAERSDMIRGLAEIPDAEFWTMLAHVFEFPHHGFLMPEAARLDTRTYLAAARKNEGVTVVQGAVDFESIRCTGGAVELPKLNLTARALTFCHGYRAETNPWFPTIKWRAAKGEILTLRIQGLGDEKRTIHANGLWMLPARAKDEYRVGSTYEWEQLDNSPTTAGRDSITSRLKQFLKCPFQVLDQQAAVRPILVGDKPIAGFHPVHPEIGYINGLGSKGSVQAPMLVKMYAAAMNGAGDNSLIDSEFRLAERFDWP